MFPKKETYKNIELLDFLKINSQNYTDEFDAIYQQKKNYFYLSLIFFIPVSLILTFFVIIDLSMPWWSLPLFLIIFSLMGFFFISLPLYQSFIKECLIAEKYVCERVDAHLSELAKQEFFSKDAKIKRLLNQEFELIALTSATREDLNVILDNQSLTTANCPIININNPDYRQTKRIFFEKRPLSPVIVIKINLINRTTKKLSKQIILPIEFELVRGLVSEQIIFFEKDNYLVNPYIHIDADNFKLLYVADRDEFLKREHAPLYIT
ncbi:hypothetical protein [Vagococcus bubulae]|uniref:Uncharacterized protein n=1 Tax=Vagococcus bubulae TaxID=1977868 RepID=A0A429ZIH2_9ENTE|nr:hypothetical protein [Vagococcus bubulae]RST93484.1 hypothetical protein CBF36_07625 [Vagococcus bubulae]